MQPFLWVVRKVYRFKRPGEIKLSYDVGRADTGVLIRNGSTDLEIGFEVAITWLGQLESQLRSCRDPMAFVRSVRSILGDVPIILLMTSADRTIVLYDGLLIPPELLRIICRPKGFYGQLARIRFTRFFTPETRILSVLRSKIHLPIESLVAVPVFKDGEPRGCLGAASFDSYHILGPREGMVLSLAASIYSLADELEESRLRNSHDKHI